MKKFTLLLLLTSSFAFSQDDNNQQVQLGTTHQSFFIKNGENFKLNQYKEVFEDKLALKQIRKARSNKAFGSVISGIGGFGMGYGLAMIIGNSGKGSGDYDHLNKKSNRQAGLIYLGMGLGVVATSIPLWIGYSKNIKKAIDTENNNSTSSQTSLNLNVNENGFGLAFNF